MNNKVIQALFKFEKYLKDNGYNDLLGIFIDMVLSVFEKEETD